MKISRIAGRMFSIVANNKSAIGLFVVFAFFRFFRLEPFVTFLGDQGRDAIIMKRIMTGEHFPAIGAPSSVGMVYLGPFYYYLIAPFLALFNFHPVGPAFGVALISLAGIALSYVLVRKLTDPRTALFFTFLTGFSATILDLSRYSWNPNLLPFFAFFTLLFFTLTMEKKRRLYAVLFGMLFSFATQLHYLAALLVIPCMIAALPFFVNPQTRKDFIQKVALSILSFFTFSSPLLLFDIKHGFINTKNFVTLITGKDLVSQSPYMQRLFDTTGALFQHITVLPLNPLVAFLLLFVFLYLAYNSKKNMKNMLFRVHLINIVTYLLLFALLNSSRYIHYFGSVYLSVFLVSASLLASQTIRRLSSVILLLILLIYLYLNVSHYAFLFQEPNHQIEEAQIVARSVMDRNPRTPYQLVSLPSTETDDHIRYFLELWGKRPLPADSAKQPTELYILCHQKTCDALNDGQWQVAAFTNKKVAATWQTAQRITIYQIIHGK